MNIKLCSSRWGELPLSNVSVDVPSHPANMLLLPGAKKLNASSEKGGYRYLFQEIIGDEFTVRFSLCYSKHKDTLTIITDPFISLHFGYLFSHGFYHPHLGKLTFHQNSYNFLFLSNAASEFTIGPYEKFTVIDIVLNEHILKQNFAELQLFKDFKDRVNLMLPSKFQPTNSVAPIEILRWLDEIIQYAADDLKDNELMDYYVKRLVAECVCQIKPKPVKRPLKINQADIDKIYHVSELLKESEKVFTIKELAALLNITPNKLESGFKQIFGHSVLHHRKEERMRMALRLVGDKRLNSKEVSSMLGFKDPQSFIRAFKKRFGYTPYRSKFKNAPEP